MLLLHHLEKLEHFIAVAKEGSFLSGAASLGLSQPTLIYSVKKLEEALDQKLFYRSRKGTTLTPTGKELLKFSFRLNRLVRDFEEDVLERESPAESLRLASHNLFLNSVIVPQLRGILKKVPQTEITLQTDPSSRRLVKWLIEGKTDIAIVAEPKVTQDIKVSELVREHYSFYCSHNYYKTMKIKKLSPESLQDHDYYYVPHAVAGHELSLSRMLWEKNIPTSPQKEFADFETVHAMVRNDYGIGILPRSMALADLSKKNLKEIPVHSSLKNLAMIKIQIAVRKDHPFDSVTRVIIEEIRKAYGSKIGTQ